MPKLPTDAAAAAKFLLRHHYKSIDVTAGSRYFAVAESLGPGADDWFWNDDNAKVLELLSRPEVWRQFRRETGEILRFIRSMCRGPYIFRRVSSPRLEFVGQQDGVLDYRHSLMQVKGDLPRGMVLAGLRFHDGRRSDQLLLAGGSVELTYRGQRFKLHTSRAIDATKAEQHGYRLTLQHSCELEITRWRPIRLGRITYTYEIDANSMVIEVEAALDLTPGVAVSDVVLTIGHENLDTPPYAALAIAGAAGEIDTFTAREPGEVMIDAPGATYYLIRPEVSSGDAYAIHSMPREPARLSGFATIVRERGKLRFVGARYAFPGAHNGTRLVAGEYKLVTTGGFYERVTDYAAFLREAVSTKGTRQVAYDFSISYDYGATLNAFAKCFAVAVAEPGLLAPEVAVEELRALLDTTLDHYFALYVDRHEALPNGIFSRELAFAMLATATMQRATGSEKYARRLARMCDVLLDFEMRFDDDIGLPASSFLMRKDGPRAPHVDCHSAALLALTQAARIVPDPRLAAVIDRGLASYGLDTARVSYGAMADTISVLMVDENGGRQSLNAFWNFKAGITLRFFAALRNAEDAALRAVAVRHQERMALLETVMRRQIEASLVEHEDGIEIRCSLNSAETNSETQPWVMLGLLGHPWD